MLRKTSRVVAALAISAFALVPALGHTGGSWPTGTGGAATSTAARTGGSWPTGTGITAPHPGGELPDTGVTAG